MRRRGCRGARIAPEGHAGAGVCGSGSGRRATVPLCLGRSARLSAAPMSERHWNEHTLAHTALRSRPPPCRSPHTLRAPAQLYVDTPSPTPLVAAHFTKKVANEPRGNDISAETTAIATTPTQLALLQATTPETQGRSCRRVTLHSTSLSTLAAVGGQGTPQQHTCVPCSAEHATMAACTRRVTDAGCAVSVALNNLRQFLRDSGILEA